MPPPPSRGMRLPGGRESVREVGPAEVNRGGILKVRFGTGGEGWGDRES